MGTTYVFNSGKNEPVLNELDLTYGMFFDGTGNNLRNTEIRKKVQQVDEYKNEEATSAEKKIYKKKGLTIFKNEKNNSFKNDFSNVARMNLCCTEAYRIYTEGIGTTDEKSDSLILGQALGKGSTGVIEKVKKGCESLAKRIKKKIESEDDIEQLIVTLDAYGFSRGAAAARNFVFEVQKSAGQPKLRTTPGNYSQTYQTDELGNTINNNDLIDGLLPPFGFLGIQLKRNGIHDDLIKNMILNIRFVGLYDTVAAYGIRHSNDAKELSLNELGSPRQVVHFTAMDEERKKFPLTRTNIGIEKRFPGVHSDIGGGYDNGAEDKNKLLGIGYGNYFSENNTLENTKNKFIEEGWYTKEQLTIVPMSDFSGELRLYANRKNIKKEYSYILLHFMEGYAKDHLIKNEFKYSTEIKYKILDTTLTTAKGILENYIENKRREWTLVGDNSSDDRTLKRLRNEYLHRSSEVGSFVNSPAKEGNRLIY